MERFFRNLKTKQLNYQSIANYYEELQYTEIVIDTGEVSVKVVTT